VVAQDVNALSGQGLTPLIIAAAADRVNVHLFTVNFYPGRILCACVHVKCDVCVCVHARACAYACALTTTEQQNRQELIELGADLNFTDAKGETGTYGTYDDSST
jgi:hypothetical protein